ncbi:MAG: hypothetical protein QXU79_04465, partial [Candidatus Micrarchaeaceae archaeon]
MKETHKATAEPVLPCSSKRANGTELSRCDRAERGSSRLQRVVSQRIVIHHRRVIPYASNAGS